MKTVLLTVTMFALISPVTFAQNEALPEAFAQYSGAEKLQFNAERGKELWNKKNTTDEEPKQRDCNACHGSDFTKAGKHVKTGKKIDPLAPSVNKERFSELKTIEKWFKRNCKWTYGRECTNQEKGDLLTYLSQQ